MKKLILIAALAASSENVMADMATTFGPATRWRYIDTHTIIIEAGSRYLVKLPFCFIYPSSSIQFMPEVLMPFGDKIVIDGQACDVQEVTRI